MNRSTNPLIRATVRATLGVIRKSLSNQPGIRIQPIAGTGKVIVPVRNGIGQRRKSVYGKRRHGISNTPSVRISCSPDNNGKVTLPVVTVQQAKIDDQLMQEIERLVEIQITRAFQTYKEQLQELQIYDPAFEPEIKTLAQLERRLTRAQKAWSASAPEGGKPSFLDPHYQVVMQLEREILTHREALGLTPKALRRLKGTYDTFRTGKQVQDDDQPDPEPSNLTGLDLVREKYAL